MMALGLIETKGLIPAIESADVMLKAADVTLLEHTRIGAGLVTISVAGEVSAVYCAVDAAKIAIGRISETALVSAHVIPRPYEELSSIVRLFCHKEQSTKAWQQQEDVADNTSPPVVMQQQPDIAPLTEETLQRWSVKRLREYALSLSQKGMLSRKNIGKADKKSLIAGIMSATRHREE